MGETKPAELQRFFAGGPERLPHGPTGKVVQRTIAELADALAGDASIADLLTTLLCASVALVPGAGCAKISVIDGGRLCSIAATSQLASALDRAQQAAGQGPCLDAISARKLIRCDDLGNDGRWPRFADTATTAGVRSVLSCPMDIRGSSAATFSLFSFRAHTFGIESEAITAVLANHAAIALVQEKQARQFKIALDSRDVIGQAKGMVMERFGVDAPRAFAMLTAISQETNTPVRDLAARLVDRVGQ
jgi:transcriptional regulator with GAF, ATPase, and Fis domain